MLKTIQIAPEIEAKIGENRNILLYLSGSVRRKALRDWMLVLTPEIIKTLHDMVKDHPETSEIPYGDSGTSPDPVKSDRGG